MFHFQVIDQQESEGQDREAKMLGDHKRALEELEEKLKKAEAVKEKLEKSKEEAIQALNDKVKTLQETHAEETQVLKTDKAKIVSEQEMLQGKSTSIMCRQSWS